MPGNVFFDTNILVYAHDTDSPEKQATSQGLIFDGVRNGSGVISAQVLSEFFVTVTRKIAHPMPAPRARREIVLISTLATVDVDATLILRAIDIQDRWQLSYWDALILAAAERGDCETVYSEDLSHGQTYENVTVQNPFA